PPGSVEETLLLRCIHCGECMQVCPTAGLQPSLLEADLEGLWTPRLVPRLGYCDYGCTNCGQVCPTEAIPRLALEEKRRVVMGLAYIDTNRCIPWADSRDCIVCEEMCPTPEKAIVLDDIETPDGRTVRRPRVLRDVCIGCGICEFKCPLEGESAIRVYAPTVDVALPNA
ncbi:MAG: 4Fe-4S dicluster domain-containing protein, partial [Chloroflexi bacterium]|nr:4Fe-4S dicluster domain-containing protein [Chloroflexota bacterium]